MYFLYYKNLLIVFEMNCPPVDNRSWTPSIIPVDFQLSNVNVMVTCNTEFSAELDNSIAPDTYWISIN